MVVDVAGISGASAFHDELALSEKAEVVGDEVLGLTKNINQLVNAVIATGEDAHELPSKIVAHEIQDGGCLAGPN